MKLFLGLLLVVGVGGCALRGSAVDIPALEKSGGRHSRLIATELSKGKSNTKKSTKGGEEKQATDTPEEDTDPEKNDDDAAVTAAESLPEGTTAGTIEGSHSQPVSADLTSEKTGTGKLANADSQPTGTASSPGSTTTDKSEGGDLEAGTDNPQDRSTAGKSTLRYVEQAVTATPPESATDIPVAALEKLGARLERNEPGEVTAVDLSRSPITDAGLEHLRRLPQLQQLNLDGTRITDDGLVILKGLTNLRELDISDTQISDAGFAELQAALPNCTTRR